jgi:hypothetical protein
MKVTVHRGYGFYLGPDSSAGFEAIVYLPAYNNSVRIRYQRKGFKLLNEAWGEFNQGGDEALVIKPPTDDTINMAVEEMQSRLAAEKQRTKGEIEYYEAAAEDAMLDTDFKKLLRLKIRALNARYGRLDAAVPTFAQLKTLTFRAHRMALAQDVDPAVRTAVERLVEERQWASATDELQEEVMREISERKRNEEPAETTA